MPIPSRDRIMTVVEPILEHFGVPGAAIAVVSGEDSHGIGWGACEKDGDAAVLPDTTFQLASCSKAYTATAAALLVDAGNLTFDDPVRKHLPEFQMHDERLSSLATLRDLLSMRLGYRNDGIVNWGRNLELGNELIFERMRYLEVMAGFRELFTYLNSAYTLVAEIIARASGKPFVEFVMDELSLPLGQTNTFIHEGQLLPKQSHAFPHVLLDEGIVPVGMAQCGGRLGESCVYSSANDAVRWMALHLGKGQAGGKRLVSTEATHEMQRPHVNAPPVSALNNHFLAYGMGWQCRDTPNGPVLLHEGGEFGVSTFTMLDPLRGNGAAVYANLNSSAAVKSCVYSLIDVLAGREPGNWRELFETLTARESDTIRNFRETALAAYKQAPPALGDIVGSYSHPANGMIDIRETAEGLEMRIRDGWVFDCVLRPAEDNFYTGHFLFRGTQSLARQGNRLCFFEDDNGMAVCMPGMGISRKLV